MISGFGCYIKYLAIKSHFLNERYDYFKYNGRVKADINSFNIRNDKFFFEKIAKKLKSDDEVEKFFVANFINDIQSWIGDILDNHSLDIFLSWKRDVESITYKFTHEFQELSEKSGKISTIFQPINGQHPELLKLYMKKMVSIEFIIIMNIISSCFRHWDDMIDDRIIWPDIMKLCEKYQPFLIKYVGMNKIKEFKRYVRDNL